MGGHGPTRPPSPPYSYGPVTDYATFLHGPDCWLFPKKKSTGYSFFYSVLTKLPQFVVHEQTPWISHNLRVDSIETYICLEISTTSNTPHAAREKLLRLVALSNLFAIVFSHSAALPRIDHSRKYHNIP